MGFGTTLAALWRVRHHSPALSLSLSCGSSRTSHLNLSWLTVQDFVPQEDDDIEEGDLPEHKRSPPPIDFSKVDASKPEELLKMSKKGRTLMVFATVSGDPTEKETEEITGLWQGSLFNANYDIQR